LIFYNKAQFNFEHFVTFDLIEIISWV